MELVQSYNDFAEMDPLAVDNGVAVNNLNHIRSDSQVCCIPNPERSKA